MRSTLLALVALCLLAAARPAQGEGNAVKLCGRDFVRAIVFTCGGSRWRRDLADYQYLFAESENPLPSSQERDGFTEQRLEAGSQEPQDAQPGAVRAARRAWKMPALKKREVAKLLTTSCCSVGCSERDISLLC